MYCTAPLSPRKGRLISFHDDDDDDDETSLRNLIEMDQSAAVIDDSTLSPSNFKGCNFVGEFSGMRGEAIPNLQAYRHWNSGVVTSRAPEKVPQQVRIYFPWTFTPT